MAQNFRKTGRFAGIVSEFEVPACADWKEQKCSSGVRPRSPGSQAGPLPALWLCRCLDIPAEGCCNVATYYLTNSRHRTLNCSGRITAFFRIIASAKKGGEAKLVQRGPIRAWILYRRGGECEGLSDGGGWGVDPGGHGMTGILSHIHRNPFFPPGKS
jgi:hypothetical protein